MGAQPDYEFLQFATALALAIQAILLSFSGTLFNAYLIYKLNQGSGVVTLFLYRIVRGITVLVFLTLFFCWGNLWRIYERANGTVDEWTLGYLAMISTLLCVPITLIAKKMHP